MGSCFFYKLIFKLEFPPIDCKHMNHGRRLQQPPHHQKKKLAAASFSYHPFCVNCKPLNQLCTITDENE